MNKVIIVTGGSRGIGAATCILHKYRRANKIEKLFGMIENINLLR